MRTKSKTIVDPKILEKIEEGDEEVQQQLHDFLSLAFSCTQLETEARPDMIDVEEANAGTNNVCKSYNYGKRIGMSSCKHA